MIRDTLLYILKILAKATLRRYQPIVVGITGSVGKTSAKEAIFAVLKNKFNVRRNEKNYNNEIGVPLTILGQETGGRSALRWVKVFLFGIIGLFHQRNYPKVLLLEMGADRIGDIAYLLSFLRPHVGVITAIGEIPVHVEFFQDANQVAQEKSTLVRSLGEADWAVLNFDDGRVRAMAGKTPARVLGYGFSEGATLRASHLEIHLEDLNEPFASFKVDFRGSNVPVRLKNILGEHQLCPVLAAMAVGLTFNLNLVEIFQALQTNYTLAPGRLRLLKGIKNSWVIDDTYNASPSSTLAALEVLAETKGRKIAVLGDMLELGFFTEEAHRRVGQKASRVAQLLLTVGARSLFIADEAEKNGLPREQILHFDDSWGAAGALQDLMQEGDVVLVKGSQGARMERITKEIMAEPQRASELLVRQDKAWLNR